jgi:hypothetical protein
MNLIALPVELLLQIGCSLPRDAIVALNLAHPVLNHSIALQPETSKEINQCVRFAIRRHFTSPTSSHLSCSICKESYPRHMFRGPNSNSAFTCAADMLNFLEGVCSWHVGRVTRVIKAKPGGANKRKSRVEKMCMHCGSIKAWFCGAPSPPHASTTPEALSAYSAMISSMHWGLLTWCRASFVAPMSNQYHIMIQICARARRATYVPRSC